ncbi:hypothetical protein, partial [Bartonella bovis]|uniref:hypothetical protein n=1 Tax=Bartonella bovis TaxID=155194 RepID=UPI003CC7CE3F
VIMESTGTMTMTNVGISQVKMGVWMKNGNLTVNGGSMTGVQTGITMLGSGKLVVNNGAITFTGGGTRNYGIGVGGTVTANITGVEIKGSGEGKGVYATGTGAVTISGVNISNVAMGVWVKGGTLTMDKGSIGFKGEHGVKIENGVTSATLT